MEGESVPEGLLGAFQRDPDGTLRVRRYFPADIAVVILGLLGSAALFLFAALVASFLLDL